MGTGSCLEALLLVRELRLAGVQRRESLHADYANLKVLCSVLRAPREYTRATDTMDTAEYGRMQLTSCPLVGKQGYAFRFWG